MNQVSGTVSDIQVFGPNQGQFGAYYRQVFRLSEFGDQEFNLSCNEQHPRAPIGTTVQFSYTDKAGKEGRVFHNVDKKTLNVVGGSANPPPAITPGAAANVSPAPIQSPQNKSFSADKENRIVLQNALAHASNIVTNNKDWCANKSFDDQMAEVYRLAWDLKENVMNLKQPSQASIPDMNGAGNPNVSASDFDDDLTPDW